MTGHEGILEKLFNTIHFGFAYMDKNFNFIRVNRKYAEYENRDTDFFVGKNYFSLYPNPENKKVFSSVAKTGISHAEYAREFVHPDGRMTYLDWTLYPIKNPINSVEGLVLCLLDATEKTQIERELKITCDNLTALIENLPGCVFIKDHKSRLVWINSYAEKNYNWNKKNLIGKSDFDIWPEQADEFRKEDLRIIKTGNKIENVNEFIYKGKRKIHHTYKFPICVEGMPPMVGGFGYDVTDLVEELERKDLLLARAADESQKELLRRKKSEEALRQIGKRLAQTERIAHLGSWKFDLRKNRFSFSGEMRTIFGLSPETKFLTFKQLLKKIHPLDRKRFLSSCLESVKSLSPINTQTGIIISGEEKFLQLAGKMKLDSMGEPIWISGTATNITDLKKTRDALLAEHLELNKSLREKILLADIASILNSSIPFDRTQKSILEKIHGTLNIDHLNLWTLTDTNELKWAEGCNPPDLEIGDKIIDKEATVSLLEALSEIQEEYISELEESSIYMALMSDTRAVSAAVIALKVSGRIIGILNFSKNEQYSWNQDDQKLLKAIASMIANGFEREMIVAQKIEAEKKQSEAVQLAEKVSYFASIGVIAGGVTHEINQPLNAIKVAADSLIFWDKKNSGLLPEKLLSMLNNISLSVNRMDEIIHRMRSMWVSPQKNIKEKFDLNQAVLNALTLSETHLKFQGIELKLDLHPEELPVFGIPVHIQQILLNLLSNAATSIEKGKRKIKLIEINTCTTPETVFMTVSDNGAGLPEGVNEKLFDPFFTTKKRGEGMGLGLAIVKKFVDEHGGRITAKNNQDWGAVFEVHFPAYTTTIGEMNEHNAC